jgi:hypothetical protein
MRPHDSNGHVDIIEGYGAVAYKRKFIQAEAWLAHTSAHKSCFLSDDVVISWSLARQRVPRMNIPKLSVPLKLHDHFFKGSAAISDSDGESSLGGHNARYLACATALYKHDHLQLKNDPPCNPHCLSAGMWAGGLAETPSSLDKIKYHNTEFEEAYQYRGCAPGYYLEWLRATDAMKDKLKKKKRKKKQKVRL